MRLFSLLVFAVLFVGVLAGVVHASVTSVVAPYSILLGENFSGTVTTSISENVTVQLRNSTGGVVNSTTIDTSVSGAFQFNSSFFNIGSWSIVADGMTHSFSVLQPFSFKILPVEHNNQGVNKTIVISGLSSSLALGLVADTNISKSGTIYNGTINESVFGCDVDGNTSANVTIYVWVSDPDTVGVYNMVFFDDDNSLTEATEVGKPPKLFLSEKSPSLKCTESSYSNSSATGGALGPFMIAHVWGGGVLLVLAPGPGDIPYTTNSILDFEVIAYNSTGLVNASLNATLSKYNTTSNSWASGSINDAAWSKATSLDNETGTDGVTNIASLNLSTYANTQYKITANEISAYPFEVAAQWNVKVIVGDPITKTENYYFEVGDKVGVGVITDAPSPTITANIFNENNTLIKAWSSSDFQYNSAGDIYAAGTDGGYVPTLPGKYIIEIKIVSNGAEKIIKKDFRVKSFEVVVAPLEFTLGKEPEFGQMGPGSTRAAIAIFALKYGVKGSIKDNIESSDLIVVDQNVTDANNTCNSSISSIIVRDSDGNVVLTKSNFTINNVYNITTDFGLQAPSEFGGECIASFTAPTVAGEYFVDVNITTSSGSSNGKEMFLIKEINTWAIPWDTQSNVSKWQFSPGANATLKVNAKNLYNGEDVSVNITEVKLLEVFNPDMGGDVTATIEGYGFSNGILWIKLSNATSGFHQVTYKAKALINASGTIRNATGIGYVGFMTKLYDIFGHPNWQRPVQYFRPDENVNFTVEVMGQNGPVSNVGVDIEQIGMDGKGTNVNFSATHGTTDSSGQANILISPPSNSNWSVGNYWVKIKAKDSQNNVDYGYGWFEVKSFQVVMVPVEVSGGNCTPQTDGQPTIYGDGYFVYVGISGVGFLNITIDQTKSKMFQYANLNGEPVYKESSPPFISTNGTCNISGIGTFKYLVLNGSNLGGEYDLNLVASTQGGAIGIGWMHFAAFPFLLTIEPLKDEPIYGLGENMEFKLTASANITNASVIRIIGMEGKEISIEGINDTVMNTTLVDYPTATKRKLSVTLPTNVTGIQKGKYVIQIRIDVLGKGSIVSNQFFELQPFSYSLAKRIQSWANDADEELRGKEFNYGDENAGSRRYDVGQCPFPAVGANSSCGLINITHIRREMLGLSGPNGVYDPNEPQYKAFVQYFNTSGNYNELRGFYLIVGTLDRTKIANARVYVAKTPSDFSNASLTPLGINDTITDDSGAQFQILEITQDYVKLKALTFSKNWEVRTAYVNNTATLSKAIKLGMIREKESNIDFNNDSEAYSDFGLPFALFDLQTAGMHDSVIIDSNMDLNFNETMSNISSPIGYSVPDGKIYLIKADRFGTIFALDRPSRDNWLGQYKINTNITIPIYSIQDLNISPIAVYDDMTQQPIDPSKWVGYNATINTTTHLGFAKVSINASGRFVIVYQVSGGPIVDIPEMGKSPRVEVKAFDSERMLAEPLYISSFTTLNATSTLLTWYEQRGYWQDWIGDNATELKTVIDTQPSGFDGYYSNSYLTLSRNNIYVLFNASNDKYYMSSTPNFTGTSTFNMSEVAMSIDQEYPVDWNDNENNTNKTINVSLIDKRCYQDGCQLVIKEVQPVHSSILVFAEGMNVGEEKEINLVTPFDDKYMKIRRINGSTNESLITIYTNLTEVNGNRNKSAPVAIAINSSGLPNNTGIINVAGKLRVWDWCLAQGECIGGDYSASVQILNVTYNEGPNNYAIWIKLNESYSNEMSWAGTHVNASSIGTLILPDSSEYNIKEMSWKGIWIAVNVSNLSSTKLFVSRNSNFSGKTGYSAGGDVPVYDRELGTDVNYKLLSLSPRDYGLITLSISQNYSFGFSKNPMIIIVANATPDNTSARLIFSDRGGCTSDYWMNINESRRGCGDYEATVTSINYPNVTFRTIGYSKEVDFGFNLSGLDATTRAIFENESYQKRIGKAELGGMNYTIITLDTNPSDQEQNFTKVIVTNDTMLNQSEIIDYGSSQNVSGYFITTLDDWRIAFMQQQLKNIPFSWDGAGYKISTTSGSSIGSPLTNSSLTFRAILYDDDPRDKTPILKRFVLDDDTDFTEQWTNSTPQLPLDSAGLEGGIIAESHGGFGEGFQVYLNGNWRNYDLWDANYSEPIRPLARKEEWRTNSTDNLTIAVRMRDFEGNPLAGNVSIGTIWAHGNFGGQWMDINASTFVNYTISYENNGVVDSDGIALINITLVNSTWIPVQYSIEMTSNTVTGLTETTDMWFNVGGGFK